MSFLEPDRSPPPAHFADRPVARPLLIFDGDCNFCRRCVRLMRWITDERANYAPSQEVGEHFPSVLPEEFAREVKLVETDGHITGAAEAVFRLLFHGGKSPWWGIPLWVYRKVPGARWISEAGYRFVAGHRMFFSRLTRWW